MDALRESEQTERASEQRENNKGVLRVYKNGAFFSSYNDDSKILNYLFGYKISFTGTVGFPETSLNKVVNALEKHKINYSILYRDHEPVTVNFKNLNNYNKVLKKALIQMENKERVDNIVNKIYNIESEETLKKILTVIEDVIIHG